MANKEASKQIRKNCKEHQEFFKLSQNTTISRRSTLKGSTKSATLTRPSGSHADRPAPILVRVPSRRYQRLGKPDGSENGNQGGVRTESGFIDGKGNPPMLRHNSTPSLMKGGSLGTRYSNGTEHYDLGQKYERYVVTQSVLQIPY